MIFKKVISTVTAIIFITLTMGCSTNPVSSTDESLGYRERSSSNGSRNAAVAVLGGLAAITIGQSMSQKQENKD